MQVFFGPREKKRNYYTELQQYTCTIYCNSDIIKMNGAVYKGLNLEFVTINSLRHEDAVLEC